MFAVGFYLWTKRDPERKIPKEGIVSPADGKVSVLREDGESNIRVGIFMNIHNVHVNRAPITGYVIGLEYIRGKFLPAFSKDSERNERVRIVFSDIDPNKNNTENVDGIGREWEVILIAGAIVRRIKPYVKIGDYIEKGERIGHIAFGSRVDVIFPRDRELKEALFGIGDQVKAGESIIMKDRGL
jgi:phosphatidylserine decarboxylase